jgi:hypothetical protein
VPPEVETRLRRWSVRKIRHAIASDDNPIFVAALDFALIVQRASHPVAHLAFSGTLVVIVLSPAMLLLLMLAADD